MAIDKDLRLRLMGAIESDSATIVEERDVAALCRTVFEIAEAS
jgi:hypothetical protein